MRGTLEREGACLYLKSESGERWLAAFPSPGTAWRGESAALALGKTTIRLGEKGSFDGGELRDGASAIAWIQPPSKECEVSKIWLVTAIHGAG